MTSAPDPRAGPPTDEPTMRAAGSMDAPVSQRDPGLLDRMAALPVALELHGRHADGVRAWVEGTLGWQPVAGATAGLVPPAVTLRDLEAPPPDEPPSGTPPASGSVPVVLLVDDAASPLRAGEVVAAMRPAAIVGWPSGRDRLVQRVRGVLDRPRSAAPSGSRLRIGGSAGGVGTTTVTLALAGLAAWRGASALAVVRGSGSPAPVVSSAALAGTGVWARAQPLPGVAGARALRLVDHDEVPVTSDPEIGIVVLDAGVDAEVDVLVCRPDAAALATVGATTASVIVVVGDGPARLKDLRRAAAGRRGIVLPSSARVARAGLSGRVPAGLPGAWLERLQPLLPGEWRSGPTTSSRST